VTINEFSEVMRYLAVAVDKAPSPDRLDIYWDLFQDLPAEVFRQAAREALLESEYPTIPAPGVLQRIAEGVLRRRAAEEKKKARATEEPISPEEHRRAWEIFSEGRKLFLMPRKN
jgi:hypothetical protein